MYRRKQSPYIQGIFGNLVMISFPYQSLVCCEITSQLRYITSKYTLFMSSNAQKILGMPRTLDAL